MSVSNSTFQEFRTSASPADVLRRAKEFFPKRNSLYAAFLEKEGPTYATFRGQGGEEIAIAAQPKDGATLVTGSSYLFDMQVTRFFATLPPAAAGATS
jgi:hypothetical protein